MRRSKRGSADPPVSLFAFQDVMTSVLAILILTALMLAVEQGAGVVVSESTAPERDRLLSRLRAAQAALERAHQDATGRGDRPLERLARERVGLQDVYRQIEQIEKALADSYKQLKDSTSDSLVAKQIGRVAELEGQVAQKRGELEEVLRNRRLTYIAGQEYGRQPILVELSAPEWRVAMSHDSSEGISLRQADRGDRLESLKGLLAAAPPTGHYILLIIKPSGFPDYIEHGPSIERLGYRLGKDALPEDWTSVVGSAGRGSGTAP